jgi:hypothetical protein
MVVQDKMPRYAYLLVFDDAAGTMNAVRSFIDSRPEILNWYTCMPNTFFMVSELPAADLTKLFREFTKDQGRFIIVDLATDRNGWLPSKAWEFIRNPKAASET